MTACRFYEAGYCRYGYRCRNDHTSGPVILKRREKGRSISPVWPEARKWRVLSEQDNLSSKFKFKVSSPTTKDWSVWDNSDSECDYEPGESKLMRLESATLSILQCPNCGSHILSGEGLDIVICETCDHPIQNSKFNFDTENIIESESISIHKIAEEFIIEVDSNHKTSNKATDDSDITERDDNVKNIVKHEQDSTATGSVDCNQNNVACKSNKRKKKKNKQKKNKEKLSSEQISNNNSVPSVEIKSESNTLTEDPQDIKENGMKTDGSWPSCPKASNSSKPKGWKKRHSRKKMLSSPAKPVYSIDILQRAIPYTIPLIFLFIWAVFL